MHWAGKTCFKYSSHFYSLASQGVMNKVVIPQFIQLTAHNFVHNTLRSKGIKMAAVLKTGFPSPMHKIQHDTNTNSSLIYSNSKMSS